MKKLFIGTLALLALVSCAPKQQCNAVHTKWAYDATIYELNTRQSTEEGTFAAAEALLPEIKESAVVFPVPLPPTKQKSSPFLTLKLKPFTISGEFFSYLKYASLISITTSLLFFITSSGIISGFNSFVKSVFYKRHWECSRSWV